MSLGEPSESSEAPAWDGGYPVPEVSGSLTALAAAPVAIAIFDTALVCRWANDAFTRIAGAGARGPVGASLANCLQKHGGDPAAVRALFDGRADTLVTELTMVAPAVVGSGVGSAAGSGAGDDRPTHWTAHFFPVRDRWGSVVQVGLVAVDSTERQRRERELTHRATHDALTGLPNRAELYERLAAAQARGARRPGTLALVMIDLDGFKSVNDRLGHLCGDRVLVEAARRLRSVIRDGDTVARLGGDEFALLCEEMTGSTGVRVTVERARTALAVPIELDRATVVVTASVGVALAVPGESTERLVSRADRAMYRAKRRAGTEFAADAGPGASPQDGSPQDGSPPDGAPPDGALPDGALPA